MKYAPFLERTSLSFLSSMLACLLLLTAPALGQDLTINNDLVIGTDPDPNGQGWDYTDETIWIGSGQNETGSLSVPAGQNLKYFDLFLGVGDSTAEGSLIISGTDALVESSRTGSSGSLMVVGSDGIGDLTIENGGQLLRRGLTIGENTGSVGIVSISGEDSLMDSIGTWLIRVGSSGTGTLTVDDQATVTGTSFLRVAEAAGSTGTVNILGGATMTAESDARIARSSGTEGTINISGENSTLTLGNFLHLGATGDGFLNVTDGGTLTVDANFTAGGITSSDTNATAQIVVDGIGSSISATDGFIWVGRYGEASLLIENGGSVSSSSEVRLGRETTGSGSLIVRGADSSLSVSDDGFFWTGDSGQGEFLIEDGGSVFAEGTIRLGVNSGSEGSGIVRGPGSSLVSDTWFRIGDEGNGTLLIEDGATVESGAFISITMDPNSVGEVTVTGENSLLKSAEFLRVGRSGTGTLTVSDGGRVEVASGDFNLGSGSAANGTATFTGSGTTLEVADEIWIGNSGVGALTLSDGAVATTAGDLIIARNSTGDGNLTVTGTSTELSVDGNLLIGAEVDEFNNRTATGGSALMTVENNATVTTGGNLILRGENTLQMDGGSLSIVGDLDLADDNGELRFILGSAGSTGLSAGNVFLDETNLEIELTYQPLLNDIITLIEVGEFGNVIGNFSYNDTVLFQGSIFEVNSNDFEQQFQISYGNSNDVTLTAVPEPATWGLLLGAGVLGLALLRRRR